MAREVQVKRHEAWCDIAMRTLSSDGQDRLRELLTELAVAKGRLAAALNAAEPDGDAWMLKPEAREAALRVRELDGELKQLYILGQGKPP